MARVVVGVVKSMRSRVELANHHFITSSAASKVEVFAIASAGFELGKQSRGTVAKSEE